MVFGSVSYPFTGDAERRPLSQDSGVNGHAYHDGISGVKDELRKNTQLHWKHGYMPGKTLREMFDSTDDQKYVK